MLNSSSNSKGAPWNKGRLIGQKRPLKPKDVWAIRVRLQLEQRRRDLALFNLAIDSKLRGCDLVRLRINDVSVGGHHRRPLVVACSFRLIVSLGTPPGASSFEYRAAPAHSIAEGLLLP